MRRWLAMAVIGAALAAGCSASHLSSASSGADLLRRAEIASGQADYQGTMETGALVQGHWITARVKCYFARPGLSRMDYLTPPMAGVIEVQGPGGAWRYDPASHRVTVVHGVRFPSSLLSRRWELIQQNYNVLVGPRQTIAGRPAVLLKVDPRVGGNPADHVWVDVNKEIILGQDHFASNGRLQSRSLFTSIKFEPVSLALFSAPRTPLVAAAPMKLSERMSLTRLQQDVGFPIALPGWLPPGYHMEASFLTRCEGSYGATVAMIRFTNGLNNITLFQSPHVIDARGACRLTSHLGVQDARLVRNNIDYVLIGDLSAAQLRRMALSIPQIPAQKAGSGREAPGTSRP